MTADTLLSTKLQIPPARAHPVVRPRLIARIEAGQKLGRRLTLISAPPGFGKTTLIRAWVDATERSAAWLSLDEGDNDPLRLLRYLVAALRQADERIGKGLPDLRPAPPQELLVALINDLAQLALDLTLILDDYHLINDFAAHDLITFLLLNQPPNFHLVVATREDPPLPLARFRAQDQITEIRERSLRFSTEEATAFLRETMNLSLSDESISSLATRAEGWVTALQLAGLAFRQRMETGGAQGTGEEFVAAFAGDDRYIVDYLMAEVLGRESDGLRSFLQQTSVLDRLCAPLCDALTGRDDSQRVLEQLEGANLFLLPLDNRREWYRYHGLFAEVLRLALPPAERVNLHGRAAQWFEAHGWEDFARHHARRGAALTTSAASVRPPAQIDQPLIEPLSERELEVLRLIAEGLSNREIAQRLFIAPGTVKRHINNIYGKLGVGSRTRAIAVARDLHIL